MKKNLFILFSLLFVVSLIQSCKEVGPNIVLRPNHNVAFDTTYIESPVALGELKNVVIEEFTGVKCSNCPEGHRKIDSIKTANPNRIVAIGMHPKNSLGLPYPGNPDLRNQPAQILLSSYFAYPGGEPAAAIDRKLFSGTTTIPISEKDTWANKVNEEIALTTPVNLKLSSSYDSSTRVVTIVTELHYTQNVTEENKLTIVLTESSIIAAQLDGTTVVDLYQHKDVLRDFVTNSYGDAVDLPHDAGRVIVKVYKYTIDAASGWKPENMMVAAYVHETSATSKIVYQGKEVSLQ